MINYQKRIYLDNLAARMRSMGQHNWHFNDMQDICELADMFDQWLDTLDRNQEESLSLKAAEKLGVEIRHYIPA